MNTNRILRALGQESTWRGLIALAAAFGITLEPELQGHIIAAALGIIGAINVVKDK